jgi:asparagine synthase (glutamine-hydrolysing)
MCGFVFLYDERRSMAAMEAVGSQAVDALTHRGPDDRGLWCENHSVSGHCRLSIIDLAASRQPMLSPGGRFVLVYNGEVYNFRRLQSNLRSRWTFRTNGDTETVLAGLLVHGEAFFEQMEGMWALALWDTRERRLLLSRDRIGKKPLFYFSDGRIFGCASELTALSILKTGHWAEDLDSTADYLRYGYYLPGTTAYQGVFELLPGHFARWSPGKAVESRAYWKIPSKMFSDTRPAAVKRLQHSLVRAVKRRLVADVEVGAFLSGGIDSSLIVSILSQILGVRSKTFTIGFDEVAFDERSFADMVSKVNRTDHVERVLTGWDRNRLTDLVLRYTGQPFADVSLLPTAMVSELAASRVKVALSGDGGDELFSGYQRYTARIFLQWYSRLPRPILSSFSKLVRHWPEPVVHHSRSLLKKAHLFLDIHARSSCETPYIAPVLYTDAEFAEIAPDLVGRGHQPPGIPAETGPNDLMRMMKADALVYLPQDIMTKVDRASMAHSLEARAPFLDRSVIELALTLPIHFHRRRMRGKRMLKDAFGSLLPAAIWQRRKQGFGVPIHGWFREDLDRRLIDLLGCTCAPIAADAVTRMLAQHQTGRRDNGYRLWNLYIYLLWLNRRTG